MAITDKSVGYISEALVVICFIICMTVYCVKGESQQSSTTATGKVK